MVEGEIVDLTGGGKARLGVTIPILWWERGEFVAIIGRGNRWAYFL